MSGTKRDYWKTVCPEFPGGVISLSLRDARDFAENEREVSDKGTVYIRKIRMTPEAFKSLSDDL